MIGAAGALTCGTRQRAHELAIESAVGAEPRDMERWLIFQALTTTDLALVAGCRQVSHYAS